MSEAELPLVLWILLGSNLFFVLLVGIGQMRAGMRLDRIEQQLANSGRDSGGAGRVDARGKAGDNEQYLVFQEFLNEDPSRNGLAKKEQFAEFRKWRKEKGMNWSA